MSSLLQLSDSYRLLQPKDPRLSPDGRFVAFIADGLRRKEDDHIQSLYIAPADGSQSPHRLGRGATQDRYPRFSPDGTKLAFLSQRPDELEVAQGRPADAPERDGEGQPRHQIWVYDLAHGGDPYQITCSAEGVESFDWSPDGQRVVFAARTPSKPEGAYLHSIRSEGGPLVIRRVQHKYDTKGYLDDVRIHLFVAECDTRSIRQLTDGPCDERSPVWAPDGQWIAFVSNRTGDPDNNNRRDLWMIRPDGSETRRLTFGDVDSSRPEWSPDSLRIAFCASLGPENSYLLSHVMVVHVANAQLIAKLSEEVGRGFRSIGGVIPDGRPEDPVAHARRYPQPLQRTPLSVLTEGIDRPFFHARWLDDRSLACLMGDRGVTRVVRLTLDGKQAPLQPLDRKGTVEAYDACGNTVVFTLSHPTAPAELYALPVGTTSPVRLTRFNETLRSERALSPHRWVQYRNSSGEEIEGLVLLPPGFHESRPSPLLVWIHGGPMAYDEPEFRFDRQYLASRGYLVLMVNYRGSISYGESFCRSIQGAWGPREHDDVVSGVDHLIELGWADPERLFCTGFSQGGIMTNWAVGHTDRFRAAVSEHGMWDYVAAFGTDDCHLWWQDDLGVPWQNPEGYREISPMSGVASIRTPLLITAGEKDWRCPLNQAEQLYMALRKRGVPTELVIYQDEHHAVSKPRRAIDRLIRLTSWLARYGGQPLADESAGGFPG